MGMMIVDVHTHIFPPAIKTKRAAYFSRDPYFRLLYSHPQTPIATAEDLIASMNRAGVDLAVALNFGWRDPELCRETNAYLLEAAQRYPDRILAACVVSPLDPGAGEEISRCAAAGAVAVGELMPDGQGFDLADEATVSPLVQAAQGHRLLLVSHASEPVGHPYPGKGTVFPQTLYAFLKAHPEALVLLAHLGGGLPFFALMPEVAQALRCTYVDTAALPYLYRWEVLHHLLAILGPERVLFGSDFPLLPQEKYLHQLRALELPPEQETMLLGENALALLRRLKDGC